MTIRMKSLLLVLVTAGLLAVIGCLLVFFIVLERFAELERKDADSQVQRLRDAILDGLEAQRSVALQWSNWDDAYRFVQQRNQDFATINLVPSALRDSRVETIAYLDFTGQLLASVTTRSRGPLPANFLGHLPGLLSEVRARHGQIGLIAIDGEVFALVALPVVDSDDTPGAEPKGVCVLLRELTPAVVGQLTRSLQAPVTLSQSQPLPLAGQPLTAIELLDAEHLRCRTVLQGLDGHPAATATIELPRSINTLARRTLRELLVAGMIALGTVTTLLLVLLEGSVLRRIVRLGREVAAQEKDPGQRITIDGRDEIAYLAGVVDRMVARQRDAAYRAEASQQRYLLLFQRSGDAIIVVDGDTIIDVNRAAARLFGAPSRKALMEVPFSRLVDGSTRVDVGAAGHSAGSSGTRPSDPMDDVRARRADDPGRGPRGGA